MNVKTRHEQSEATRAKLVRVGRDLFARRGYAGVSTEEIVRRAGVTRGALYHHFRDKRDLFAAVVEQVEQDVMERVAAAALRRAIPGSSSAPRSGPTSTSASSPPCSGSCSSTRLGAGARGLARDRGQLRTRSREAGSKSVMEAGYIEQAADRAARAPAARRAHGGRPADRARRGPRGGAPGGGRGRRPDPARAAARRG